MTDQERFEVDLRAKNCSPQKFSKAQIVALKLSGVIPVCLDCDCWTPTDENPDLGHCSGGQGSSYADETCPEFRGRRGKDG